MAVKSSDQDGCLELKYAGPNVGHSIRDCSQPLSRVLCELDLYPANPGW
jgi:hypothetical protein